MEEKKQSRSVFIGLFKWKLEEKELQSELDHYDAPGFFSSTRKIAAAFLIFGSVLGLIFTMVGWFPGPTSWVDIVLGLILAFFVYRGKKWAMVAAMIYLTVSKGLAIIYVFSSGIFGGVNIIAPVIWWAFYMGVFWPAYQIERARHKLLKKISKETNNNSYCSNCGAEIKAKAKFCFKCGKKNRRLKV